MDVAISGDRGSCLTADLGQGAYLFAVAHGFGQVEGRDVSHAVLARLRGEFERHGRGEKLRRKQRRSSGAAGLLSSAFERVNDEIHARTASHEDFVTAACSLTGIVLLDERAYLAHVGSTAAYLARDGYVVSLTKNEAFECDNSRVLTRAIGMSPSVEVAVCSFSLNEGDSLVLSGRRLRENDERRRLAEALTSSEQSVTGEQLLVVKYTPPENAQVPAISGTHHLNGAFAGVFATIVFYILLCLH